MPDAPAELRAGAQCDKRAREGRRRAGQLRLGHARAGHVRGQRLAGNSEQPLAIGFACQTPGRPISSSDGDFMLETSCLRLQTETET